MKSLSVNENDKILIIAPHPDDECIGAGGILNKYHTQCDVWLLTDGYLGRTAADGADIREIRKKEFIKEMELLNVNAYLMYGLGDGTLCQHTHFLEDKSMENYTKIFVPNKADNHMDHGSAFYMAQNALIYQGLRETELYQYEVSTPLSYVSHIMDITDCMEKKLKCISLHQSQVAMLDYCNAARSLNSYRAAIYQYRDSYVEAYALTDVFVENKDPASVKVQKDMQKFKMFFYMYDAWISAYQKGANVAEYLLKKGYKSVAVYGYGKIGKRLCEELENSDIEISCVVDKLGDRISSKYNIIKPSDSLKNYSMIIITAIYDYASIAQELRQLGCDNFMSLETILDECG